MRSARLIAAAILVLPLSPARVADAKPDAIASIERQAPELIRLSEQIGGFAETALRETKSAALLASHAEQHGFRVTRGVAGMPTAFTG